MLDYNSFKDRNLSDYFSRDKIKQVLEDKDGSIVPDNLLQYKEQREQRRMRLLSTIARHLVEDALEREYLQTHKNYNKIVHEQLISKHRKKHPKTREYEPLEHYKDPQNKFSNLIIWDPKEMEKIIKQLMSKEAKQEQDSFKTPKMYPLAPFPTLEPDVRTRKKRPDSCRTKKCPVYPSAYARRPENTIIADSVKKNCKSRVKSARTSKEWHTDLDYLLKPQSPLLHTPVKRNSKKARNIVMDLTPRFAYLNSPGKRIALVRMKYLGVSQDEMILVDPKLTRRSTVNELNPHVRTIEVKQQINGGNDLTAFRGRLVPGAEFSFISRRSIEERFSLTIYVDGTHNVRVNTCCEFRHSMGSKLGGSAGNFVILSVQGPNSCFKCKAAQKLKELSQKNKHQKPEYADDFEKKEEEASNSSQVCKSESEEVKSSAEQENTVLEEPDGRQSRLDRRPSSANLETKDHKKASTTTSCSSSTITEMDKSESTSTLSEMSESSKMMGPASVKSLASTSTTSTTATMESSIKETRIENNLAKGEEELAPDCNFTIEGLNLPSIQLMINLKIQDLGKLVICYHDSNMSQQLPIKITEDQLENAKDNGGELISILDCDISLDRVKHFYLQDLPESIMRSLARWKTNLRACLNCRGQRLSLNRISVSISQRKLLFRVKAEGDQEEESNSEVNSDSLSTETFTEFTLDSKEVQAVKLAKVKYLKEKREKADNCDATIKADVDIGEEFRNLI